MVLTDAIVVAQAGAPFTYQQVEFDNTLRADECEITIKATGVCHTDLNFARETSMPELFPCVLGHEGAGVVRRVGSAVTKVAPGDRVIVCYSCCGECRFCVRRQTSYCDAWFQYNFGVGRLDGSKVYAGRQRGERITSHFFGQSSFARRVLVMENGLVRVEQSEQEVGFERLAPLGCGVMTGAGAMLNVLQPTQDMNVAVVGAGAVGLSAIMSLKLLERPPRRIIAIDIVPGRLELARKYGATHGVNAKVHKDLMVVLMDITKGQGVDGSIDTTGRPEIIKGLTHGAARKGKVVTVGVGDLSAEASHNMFEMVQSGGSYIGCNQGDCYPQEFLPMLLKANVEGKFPYHELIKTYKAEDIETAARDIHSGATVKAVLCWE